MKRKWLARNGAGPFCASDATHAMWRLRLADIARPADPFTPEGHRNPLLESAVALFRWLSVFLTRGGPRP
jgi:hypothetical protein